MITAQKKLKLITYNVGLLTPCVNGVTEIELNFTSTSNIYENKPLKILTDNNVILSGIVIYSIDKKLLLLDNPLTGNEYVSNAFYKETFESIFDNETLTLSDIKRVLITSEDLYLSDNLIKKGFTGLLTGNDKLKLNNTKYQKTYNNNLVLTTTAFSKIGNVNINKYFNDKYKTFEHIFGITGNDFSCKIKITIPNFSHYYTINVNQFEIEVIEFSTKPEYSKLELILNLTKKYDELNNINYLSIDGKFDVTKLLTVPPSDSFKIFHYISNENDVFLTNITTPNNVILQQINNGVISSNFVVTNNTRKFNRTGITNYDTNKAIKINNNDDLNNYVIPGNYYVIPTQVITSITHRPVNDNQPFNLEVISFNKDNILNPEYLLQKYNVLIVLGTGPSTYYESYTFERVATYISNVLTWSNWFQNGKKIHTHVADDIITNPLKMFVTQTDINNWNSILSSTTLSNWKPTVNTPSALNSNYPSAQIGWNSYVISTNSIWQFNGSTWIDTNKFANETTNGIISKEQFNEFFIGASLSKKITGKESFCSRLTDEPELIYGSAYNFINENHIDLVKRTTPLTNQLKEYTYQNGWEINMFGSNSIGIGKNINSDYNFNYGIGNNLTFSQNNQTLLGFWNEINNNILFGIGNGTSTARNNLFSIFNTGITRANGYSIPSGTVDDLLVGNGSKISKQALIDQLYLGITQADTEIFEVGAGNPTFNIEWDETLIAKFGKFGKIQVYLKTAENIYSLEEVPIQIITEINITTGLLTALTYTITLSELEAIILVN